MILFLTHPGHPGLCSDDLSLKNRIIMQVKLISILLLAGCLQVSARGYGQQVTLHYQGATLKEVIQSISRQTGYNFVYNLQQIKSANKITVDVQDVPLSRALERCFKSQPLAYVIVDKTIIIKPRTVPLPVPMTVDTLVTVSGVVKDKQGDPLTGVTVSVKNTSVGTVTDAGGAYSLQLSSSGAVLVFSYVGYLKTEVPLDGRSSINVVMEKNVSALDQLVVVGYGMQKKSDLTGSLSQIKSEQITAFPTTGTLQAMEGRTPGVQVFQSTGAPGAGMNVLIRGRNSIEGGNEPLYVVDGFPVNGNPTFLDKSDIKSIDVLKDASATAIYGSRGANGVVLITTKDGQEGQTRVTVDMSYSSQTLRKKLDLMGGSQYAQFINMEAANDGLAPYFTQAQVDSFGKGFDWQNLVFTRAPMKSTDVNISGGNAKTRFSVSGSFLDQAGIVTGSNYKRYSLYSKINHTISRKFEVNLSTILTRLETARKDNGGGARGSTMISAAISAAPISQPYNADGSINDLANEYPFVGPDIINPMYYIKEQSTEIKANIALANAALIYHPIADLALKISGGIENRDDRTDSYTTTRFKNSNGSASVGTTQFTSLLSETTLTYDKTFSGKHHLSAVGGFTYQDFLNTSLGGSGVGFLSDVFQTDDLGAAETPGFPGSGYSKSVLLSYLGRVNYSYANKYLATASFRADGSSKYSSNQKWGYFPSVALAWHASEEHFLKNNSLISDLKVRGSWGLTGSQAIDAYATLDQLGAGKTVFGDALYPTFSPRTTLPGDLKWETTEQIDFGVDLGILDNRFLLTADYYIKNTRDLLNNVSLPPSMGFTTTIRNVGRVKNSGLELGLDARVLTHAFKWDVDANISFNRNKVVRLYDGEDVLGGFVNVLILQDDISILREGRPIGQFYGYLEDGYDATGHIRYKDVDGDGSITAGDKVYIGNPNPDFIYGFTSQMSYKNFELTVFLQGTYGNDIFDASSIPSTLDYGRGLNMPKEVLTDHWTPEHTNAKYPVISQNSSVLVSNRFIENGSYMRLKNIQLAYNFPVQHYKAQWLTSAQLYVSGQNLLTLTSYSWWDPEMSASGIDHYQYPVSKVLTVGVRVGF